MNAAGLISRITIWTILAITAGIVLFFFFRSDEKVQRLSEFEEPLDTLSVIRPFELSTHLGNPFTNDDLTGVITVWSFISEDVILNQSDSVLVAEVSRLQEEFAIDNSYSKENVTQVALMIYDCDSLTNEDIKNWFKANGFLPTRVKSLFGEAEQSMALMNDFDLSANALVSKPVWFLIDPEGKIRGMKPDFGYTVWSDFNRDYAKLDREYKKGR
jgi:hypothetical protein